MSQLIQLDALLTGRPTETSPASMRRHLTPESDVLEWDCPETVSGLFSVPAHALIDPPLALPMGTVAKGRFLFLLAEDAVSVYINGASTDPFMGRFLILESDDTTGITSVHVKNGTSAAVVLEYYLGGDIVP